MGKTKHFHYLSNFSFYACAVLFTAAVSVTALSASAQSSEATSEWTGAGVLAFGTSGKPVTGGSWTTSNSTAVASSYKNTASGTATHFDDWSETYPAGVVTCTGRTAPANMIAATTGCKYNVNDSGNPVDSTWPTVVLRTDEGGQELGVDPNTGDPVLVNLDIVNSDWASDPPKALATFSGSSDVGSLYNDADWSVTALAKVEIGNATFPANPHNPTNDDEHVTTVSATVIDPLVIELDQSTTTTSFAVGVMSLGGIQFDRASSDLLAELGAEAAALVPVEFSITLQHDSGTEQILAAVISAPLSGNVPDVTVGPLSGSIEYYIDAFVDPQGTVASGSDMIGFGFDPSGQVATASQLASLIAASFLYDESADSWTSGALEFGFIAPLPVGIDQFEVSFEASVAAAVQAVPEPSTALLVSGGLAVMAIRRMGSRGTGGPRQRNN